MKTKTHLDLLRMRIDAVDTSILSLLSKRLVLAQKIGMYKKAHGMKLIDRQRWERVLSSTIEQGSKRGLPADMVKAIWHVIHRHMLQKENEETP